MIDRDSSGLIGTDESEGLGGGSGRQDLWLASCCQLKRRLKPLCPAKRVWSESQHTHTDIHHLGTSTPPSFALVVFDHP